MKSFNSEKDLLLYLEAYGYSRKKKEIYVYAYKHNLNIYPYLNENIPLGRLKQIIYGLKSGVDVSIYDDYTVFRQDQMREIRQGLEAGIDVSCYAKPEFKDRQMAVIKVGLLRGLDVSIYCDPQISSSKMWQYYYRLIELTTDAQVRPYSSNNPSRFNLEDFKHQRIDFVGIISTGKIISSHMVSFNIKNLYWNEEYVCDHAWVNWMTDRKFMNNSDETFDYGDTITFSASVEPYLHRKDGLIHYGLSNISNVNVLYKGEQVSSYPVGQILSFYEYEFDQSDDEHSYNRFCNQFDFNSNNPKIDLHIEECRQNDIIMSIWQDEKKLERISAHYNVLDGRNRISIADYRITIDETKRRRLQKLTNTYLLARFFNHFVDRNYLFNSYEE